MLDGRRTKIINVELQNDCCQIIYTMGMYMYLVLRIKAIFMEM